MRCDNKFLLQHLVIRAAQQQGKVAALEHGEIAQQNIKILVV
jgi:hypothetical protein